MLHIGSHLSSAKGYLHMGQDALSIGADTFQFFTRNPRGANAKALNPRDLKALSELLAGNRFAPVIAHAPYTLNACSSNPSVRELAVRMFGEDLALMEYLPGNLYNFHPGSHLGQGVEEATAQIATLLNHCLKPGQHTTVLLETMAGKGTEVGRGFEELRQIIDRTSLGDQLGVCVDICHISDSGYDVVGNLDGVLEEFDRVIGLGRLKAVHLNDSLNPMGSQKDRHAKIGEGFVGLEAAVRIINHPQLRGLPFVLETPNDLAGHGEEIKLLKSLYRENCGC